MFNVLVLYWQNMRNIELDNPCILLLFAVEMNDMFFIM